MINLRMQLGECLKSIRFCSMTIKDFNECYKTINGFFTSYELEDIMTILKASDVQPKIFNPVPRHAFNKQTQLICEREQYRCGLKESAIEPVEIVHFTSNFPVLLGGFQTKGIRCAFGADGHPHFPDNVTRVVVTELSNEPRILCDFNPAERIVPIITYLNRF